MFVCVCLYIVSVCVHLIAMASLVSVSSCMCVSVSVYCVSPCVCVHLIAVESFVSVSSCVCVRLSVCVCLCVCAPDSDGKSRQSIFVTWVDVRGVEPVVALRLEIEPFRVGAIAVRRRVLDAVAWQLSET